VVALKIFSHDGLSTSKIEALLQYQPSNNIQVLFRRLRRLLIVIPADENAHSLETDDPIIER
jgi:hypothetical protein